MGLSNAERQERWRKRQQQMRDQEITALTELKQLIEKGIDMNTVKALQTLRDEISGKLDAMIARVRHSEAGYKASRTKGKRVEAEAGRKAAATRKARQK
jgi:hypothetical protein